jgi:hypothetical protein
MRCGYEAVGIRAVVPLLYIQGGAYPNTNHLTIKLTQLAESIAFSLMVSMVVCGFGETTTTY